MSNNRKKREEEILKQISEGAYKSESKKRLEQARANIQKRQEEIAPVKKSSSASGSGGGFSGTKNTEKKWYQKILQTPEAFKDGYNFGDVTKTVGSTVADVGLNILKAPVKMGTNIGKGIASGVAQVADWTGNDEYAEKVRNRVAGKEDLAFGMKENPFETVLDKGTDKVGRNSVIGDTGDNLAQGAGYLATLGAVGKVAGTVAGALGKGAGAVQKATGVARDVTMFANSAGGTFTESYQKEDVEDWQVWTKAIGSGYLTTKIEKLGGLFGKGQTVDTKIANAITNRITSSAGQLATRMGISATSEMAEEFLEYAGNQGLDWTIDKINSVTSKNDATYLEEWDWNEAGENMFAGFILGGGAKGLQYTAEIADIKQSTGMSTVEAINEVAKRENIREGAVQQQIPTREDIEAQIEQKIAEQEQTQDQREKDIIQDEINVLQEEASNIPSTEQKTQTEQVAEAKKEAEQIVKDITRNIELEQQAQTEQQQQEYRNKIAELEQQLAPLQEQLEQENTNTHAEEITKLEDLKTKYTNASVQKSIDNQINRLKQDSAETQSTESLQSMTDEDITNNPVDEHTPLSNDVAISEGKTDVKTKIKETFGLKPKATKELYDKVANVNSVEQVREVLEDYKDINEKVTDDRVKEARAFIRNTKKDVSQFKESITDYGDFYRKNGRRLNIGNGGTPVDTFYQELTEMYPDFFDSNVTNVADQLEAIKDFMDNNEATYTQKVGEITENDLNQLAEELYAEVHANEFDNSTNTKDSVKDLHSVIDQEENTIKEIKKQVNDIKTQIDSFKTMLKDTVTMLQETRPLEKTGKSDIINTEEGIENEQQTNGNVTSTRNPNRPNRTGSDRTTIANEQRDNGTFRTTSNQVRLLETNDGNLVLNNINNVIAEMQQGKPEDNYSAFVSPHTAEEYSKGKTFYSEDGKSTVTVTEDGDVVSVISTVKGRGGDLLLKAIENGGKKLDNYSSTKLTKTYQKYGFVPVAKVEFADEYAPDNWNYERDGRPYIVVMAHNGLSVSEIQDNIKNNNISYVDIESLPTMEYDEALAYRDNLINEAENSNKGSFLMESNFELTAEQQARVQELKDDTKTWTEHYRNKYADDKEFADKRIKSVIMQNSALIRETIQGDLLIPVEGGLTFNELKAKISKLKGNYKGKEVIVDGKQGKVIGNSFGKIGVEFPDGTKQYVEKDLVQPLENIDQIIQEQTRQYEQYKQSKGENIPIKPQTLQVSKEVAPSKKVPENALSEEQKPLFDKESKFYRNITERSEFLNEDIRENLKSEDDIRYYQSITNEETLTEAMNRFTKGGESEVLRWLDSEVSSAVDVAEGWILLENYRDKVMTATDEDAKNNYAQRIASIGKKMREMGTKGGQIIQAFSIQERLTPDGMLKYAQSELLDLYKIMSKNKGKDWIDKYSKDFELNANDTILINNNMTEIEKINSDEHFVSNKLADLKAMDTTDMNEAEIKKHNLEVDLYENHDIDYIKRVKMAEIQKQMQDKIPPVRGQALKSWMRISMLFNPKTQVRNIGGNALLLPVNIVSDTFSSVADSIVAKTTGVRTKGNFELKSYKEGFSQGIYESWSDFKRGVNTKVVESKYEVSQGKSFNEHHTGMLAKPRNTLSKGLNKTESLLNFVMDLGDRGFMKASTLNSLNNQIALNTSLQAKQKGENILISTAENSEGIAEVTYADGNGTIVSKKMNASKVSDFLTNNDIKDSIPVTKEMLTIAENEGLQRTWNDDNEYTRFVLGIRRSLNKFGVEGYGLGDVLIPFAKTPANITKAIIDYSPAGMVKTIIDGVNLKKSVENGQFTAEAQHQFVTELGKATAGTMLYALGTALALAGATSGSGDEDKDVKNFVKNTLGLSPYSIEIFGKSFTYNWAQPVSAPLAITADIVKSVQSDEERELGSYITQALDLAGNLVLEQSFMQSLNSVLTNQDGFVSGLIEAVLDLPARAVPTFSKQIVDMLDGTTRQTFEYDNPVQSTLNSVINKIPFMSDDLAPSVDTLGNDIQKYGGENNVFNTFFNPATVNSGNINIAGEEIYRLYEQTGNKTVMPVTTPYYVKKDGKKINLSSEQRTKIQRMSGSIVDDNVSGLLSNAQYKAMSDEDKASVVADLVNYANQKAQSEILGTELASTYSSVDKYVKLGGSPSEYYVVTNSVNKANNEYQESKDSLDEFNSNYDDKVKELSNTKKAKVIDIMLDLDATDQQKEYLYTREFSSEETVNKILDNGTSMDTYLQFEKDTIGFSADKDEDGKTISGSEDSKYEEYLLTSNLNDNDKRTLYEYAVLSDFDNEDKYKDYKVIKQAEIDIDSYLSYASQTFVADKKSNGKTISGSRKDKIFNYINSLNLSVPQKAIMFKAEYNADDTYNNQIIEYVDTLNISYEEKIKLVEDIGMKVDDNGYIWW